MINDFDNIKEYYTDVTTGPIILTYRVYTKSGMGYKEVRFRADYKDDFDKVLNFLIGPNFNFKFIRGVIEKDSDLTQPVSPKRETTSDFIKVKIEIDHMKGEEQYSREYHSNKASIKEGFISYNQWLTVKEIEVLQHLISLY